MNNIIVSVVIVSMDNLDNLFPCLESVYKSTKNFSFEVLVVAYRFSHANLIALREKFPKILIIESNEIRGFSENNNLALRKARGQYAFVLNDDTSFTDPIIDTLVQDFTQVSQDVAVISPAIHHINLNRYAVGKMPIGSFLRRLLLIWNIYLPRSKQDLKYINQDGLFQTYNISGSAFLIRLDIFRKISFFDEQYFFCPEDVALSTLLNEIGFKCYVDSTVMLTHLQGVSYGRTSTATYPAGIKGEIIWAAQGCFLKKLLLIFMYSTRFVAGVCISRLLCSLGKSRYEIVYERYRNALIAIFQKKSPKDVFKMFFLK